MEYGEHIVSQFQMSSGECLLISLIDFINNLVIKGGRFNRFLFLIDEVELALHPGAIDRMINFLNKLMLETTSELVVYFSTHSAELIQKISPRHIYLVENNLGTINLVNPCYPNYAVRSLYIPNGFDFVLLVEDELAKGIVDKVIRENNLAKSKLCCVLPAGGCTQMLKLHHDMLKYNNVKSHIREWPFTVVCENVANILFAIFNKILILANRYANVTKTSERGDLGGKQA